MTVQPPRSWQDGQVPDYDLTRLGSRAFEQLVVALARRELGPGVEAFGDGRDGGREATFDGTIQWSATAVSSDDSRDVWSGHTVLQAKFQVKPKPHPHDNAVWLQNEISAEIAKWTRAAENGTRDRHPDYLIFVTNVDLTPVAKVGGIDTLNAFLRRKLDDPETRRFGLRVEGFRIWHADQLRTMLDANQEVRWAYPGLLTVGDVLSRLGHDVVSLGSLDMRDPLRQELLRALKADRWIRLGQAGGSGDAKLWLDDIAIDLPALVDTVEGKPVQAVQHVLEVGDMVLRARQPHAIERPHLVLVGGPGQGKSTLSQLIAQSYRVAMLTGADLGPTAQEIVDGTREALDRLGLAVPANRRWPARIDLAKYAEELASSKDISLLRWVAQQISKRTVDAIQPSLLRQWLRVWPWALILDGLDEVPDPEARRTIYEKIDDLLTDAEDLDADLLIVVTTRPTGYDERLPEDRYRHLQLLRIPPHQAAAFAETIVEKRFPDDEDMRLKVAERMHDAARDPVTVRLMETPLQVTIMSMIVEKYPTLPPDRFTLFSLYYQTVSDREIAKDIPEARFLSKQRGQIDRLHEQVGLILQADSETADGADAHMSQQTLHNLASARLIARGFSSEDASETAAAIVKAATTRLVLLVPRDTGVGFDIRTLQELMAARAIIEGDDAQVVSRLRRSAHHPHWRNTWLLAVGALLLRSDRFERLILDLLRQLDTDPRRLNAHYPTAPSLAADILEDNLAAGRPSFERGLVTCLLGALDRPPAVDLPRLADAIVTITDTPYRRTVFEHLAAAQTAGPRRRAASALILDAMARATRDTGRLTSINITRQKLALTTAEEQAVAHWVRMAAVPQPNGIDLAIHLEAMIDTQGLEASDAEILRTGLTALTGTQFALTDTNPGIAFPVCLGSRPIDPLLHALEREDIANTLDLALNAIPEPHWAIEAMLGALVKPAQKRLAVGRHLLEEVQETQASFSA